MGNFGEISFCESGFLSNFVYVSNVPHTSNDSSEFSMDMHVVTYFEMVSLEKRGHDHIFNFLFWEITRE